MLIGPIDISDWNTMLLLRSSISYMKTSDYVGYLPCIEKETQILKYFMSNIPRVTIEPYNDIHKVA